jgi:hypothetical protein
MVFLSDYNVGRLFESRGWRIETIVRRHEADGTDARAQRSGPMSLIGAILADGGSGSIGTSL